MELSARVLLVDDDEHVRRAASRLLRQFSVDAVSGHSEACAAISRVDYALVLCDLNMPDGTGQEVYEAARRLRPGLEARFVFLSGGALDPDVQRFLESISPPMLEKPVSAEALTALVAARVQR